MKQVWLILLSLILATMGAVMWIKRSVSPPVETVVASSLKSLQEQNRLSAFAARFVTVVTSRKEQLGFAAEKTLIMPAMVRYEVDLAKLKQNDLVWDAGAKILTITLPPVEISGPEFALDQTKEYGSGANSGPLISTGGRVMVSVFAPASHIRSFCCSLARSTS